jgi:hypothetical protein
MKKSFVINGLVPTPPPGVQFASEEGYELGAHIIEATEGESLSGFFKQGESFPEI